MYNEEEERESYKAHKAHKAQRKARTQQRRRAHKHKQSIMRCKEGFRDDT